MRKPIILAGLAAVAALVAPAMAHGPDAALVTQIAQLRAEVARLQVQVAAMDQRAGLNNPEYRIGSPASRLVEIRNSHGAITLDRDGVNIQADRIRINGRALTLGGDRVLDITGGAIVIDGRSVDVKGASDTPIKGSALRNH